MSAPDTVLILGDFEFSGMEVPERIPVGGSQRTVAHTLVGGKRVVDSMGRSDHDLQWSGWFLGDTASDRAQYLDGLRVAGQELQLTWAQYNYQVIIVEFSADYERFYQLPYRITCQVVADNTIPVPYLLPAPIDDALDDDLLDALTLTVQIGDPTLTGLMASLSVSIDGAGSFANAPQSVINAVLTPLAAVQVQVSALMGPLDVTLGASSGFAGIVAGGSPLDSIAALNVQVAATTQMTNLLGVKALCGRMHNNLLGISQSDLTIATAGGNLFQISADQYGDAMAWTGIAKANGLVNPFISGAQTLTIPTLADNLGGILGA